MKIDLAIGRNRIIVAEPYFERVRFRKGEMYANYDLLVTPNLDRTISISHDETINSEYLYRLPYYLQKYIDSLQNLDISITGLNFMLTNHKIGFDSKPISYDASLSLSLRLLIQRESTKYQIEKTNLNCKHYEFNIKHNSNSFTNTIYEVAKLNENRIYHDQTLAIINNFNLKLTNSNIVIDLQTNNNFDFEYENNFRKNIINIYYKKDNFSWREIYDIKEVMKLIKKNIYANGLNLKGFDLYLSKPNEKSIIDESFILNFEWAIRNLLSDKNSIVLLNETNR